VARKSSFPIWTLIVVSSGLEAIKFANVTDLMHDMHEKYLEIWKKEK